MSRSRVPQVTEWTATSTFFDAGCVHQRWASSPTGTRTAGSQHIEDLAPPPLPLARPTRLGAA
jgi:hypothetical protein